MALKTKAAEPDPVTEPSADDRRCECGVHADIYDGRCRRCQLLPGADSRTESEVVADEPKPYAEWTKAALTAEVKNRRAAGETVDVPDNATVEQMAAALETEDAARPDAVFVTE